jgi:hypothetical protein
MFAWEIMGSSLYKSLLFIQAAIVEDRLILTLNYGLG